MFFLVMIVLSAIGLLVGGVGVVAIMMISVTERTREIGVRKALGATRATILWQFLVEAVTLTGIGAAIGLRRLGPRGADHPVGDADSRRPCRRWPIVAALGASAITGRAVRACCRPPRRRGSIRWTRCGTNRAPIASPAADRSEPCCRSAGPTGDTSRPPHPYGLSFGPAIDRRLRVPSTPDRATVQLFEAVRLALSQIRVQKLKSFFTLLGVMIGVMFLIAVVSIVAGNERVRGERLRRQVPRASTRSVCVRFPISTRATSPTPSGRSGSAGPRSPSTMRWPCRRRCPTARAGPFKTCDG